MKLIFTIFWILTSGYSVYGQHHQVQMRILKAESPVLIINDSIIGSASLLNNLPSNKVSEINIFKDEKLSTTYLFRENQKNSGIITAKVNDQIKTKSQKELNAFFGLEEQNDVYVNGYLIDDKNKTISAESIVAIELIKADNFRLKKPVLNITIQ